MTLRFMIDPVHSDKILLVYYISNSIFIPTDIAFAEDSSILRQDSAYLGETLQIYFNILQALA